MSCIFCKIVAGEIPADLLANTEEVIAFADINPQAPTHILIVPKKHVENAAELAETDPNALAALFRIAKELANNLNLVGYRTVFNTGAEAGQSVFHAHLHLLGGRALGWPPG
jgi:histidine triad (HIT) family protein